MSTLQPPAESSFTTSGGDVCGLGWEISRGDRHAVWIRLTGELDLACSARLKQTLCEAVATQRLIVLDLSGLAFMDSSGLHAMIDADNRARLRGSKLVIIRGPPQIDRLFELVGISDRLEIVELGGSWESPVEDPSNPFANGAATPQRLPGGRLPATGAARTKGRASSHRRDGPSV